MSRWWDKPGAKGLAQERHARNRLATRFDVVLEGEEYEGLCKKIQAGELPYLGIAGAKPKEAYETVLSSGEKAVAIWDPHTRKICSFLPRTCYGEPTEKEKILPGFGGDPILRDVLKQRRRR